MGTILESDKMSTINQASEKMLDAVHNLGIARVGSCHKN